MSRINYNTTQLTLEDMKTLQYYMALVFKHYGKHLTMTCRASDDGTIIHLEGKSKNGLSFVSCRHRCEINSSPSKFEGLLVMLVVAILFRPELTRFDSPLYGAIKSMIDMDRTLMILHCLTLAPEGGEQIMLQLGRECPMDIISSVIDFL